MISSLDLLRVQALLEPSQRAGLCLLALDRIHGEAIVHVLAAVREKIEAGASVGVIVGRPSATLAQLARSLAAELGPTGVRFNAVAVQDDARMEDAAAAIAFLASAEASYVTGVMLEIGRSSPG